MAALKTLQNATTIYGENYLIESTVKNIKNEFRSMIIEQAEISFKNSGYQTAISVLSEGLEVLDQDPELLTMIEEYKLKKTNSTFEFRLLHVRRAWYILLSRH